MSLQCSIHFVVLQLFKILNFTKCQGSQCSLKKAEVNVFIGIHSIYIYSYVRSYKYQNVKRKAQEKKKKKEKKTRLFA